MVILRTLTYANVIVMEYIMAIQEMMKGLKKTNTVLRYDRYVKELEQIEKKRARKIKQILEIKKRISQ